MPNRPWFMLIPFSLSHVPSCQNFAMNAVGAFGGGSIVEEITTMSVAKMIQSEYGQIFECVNVNLQPSLQHPLLKNHIVQMRPSSFPNSLNGDPKSKFAYQKATTSDIACPSGTVPIHKNYGRSAVSRSFSRFRGYEENEGSSTHTAMVAIRPATVRGSLAMITVYEPDVGTGNPPRYSGAVVQIQNGNLPNISTIYVGWFVDPHLYGDKHAHFEIAWSDDVHGCTNLLCGGFVQVNSKVAPGAILSPVSTINGTQYVIAVAVFQDTVAGNWWLTFGAENYVVGYWPKELFTYMADAANEIGWVGVVGAAHGEPCPPMGSGKWPDEGEGKAAYCAQVKIVDERSKVVVPNLDDCVVQTSDPKCYQIGRVNALGEGLHFYFGGAGCPEAG